MRIGLKHFYINEGFGTVLPENEDTEWLCSRVISMLLYCLDDKLEKENIKGRYRTKIEYL